VKDWMSQSQLHPSIGSEPLGHPEHIICIKERVSCSDAGEGTWEQVIFFKL
jgi:hypothetical protein